MSKKPQYSLPLINGGRSRASSLNRSIDENNPEIAFQKLPMSRMTSVLRKIGAGDRSKQMFVPTEEDQEQFKRKRLEQLTREYSPQRYVVKQKFNGDLDQIVMDCYKYGDNIGRKTVWKRYRQHCDDLSFSTWKVLSKKQ